MRARAIQPDEYLGLSVVKRRSGFLLLMGTMAAVSFIVGIAGMTAPPGNGAAPSAATEMPLDSNVR